jgi:hypothetical protein
MWFLDFIAFGSEYTEKAETRDFDLSQRENARIEIESKSSS